MVRVLTPLPFVVIKFNPECRVCRVETFFSEYFHFIFFFPNLQNKKKFIFSNRFENKVSPYIPAHPAHPHRKQSKTYKNHHAHNQRMT
jgi:hypothetical protein